MEANGTGQPARDFRNDYDLEGDQDYDDRVDESDKGFTACSSVDCGNCGYCDY